MQAEYLQWAEANGFMSMLPKDAKQLTNKPSSSKQGWLNGHLQPTPIKEKAIPYSNEWFSETAIQWLVNTDQVTYSVVAFMIILVTFS